MGQYTALLSHITNIVKANDNQEITGTNMQEVLVDMVNTIGAQQLRGVAVPTTNPSIPSGYATYVAYQAGNYVNFGVTIATAGLYLIDWDPTTMVWEVEAIPVASDLWLRDAINGYLYPKTISDKVAIGHTAPAVALDVVGAIRFRSLSMSILSNVVVNDNSGNLATQPKTAFLFDKQDKFPGFDRLTVPQAWDIVIDNVARTVTLGTLDGNPVSSVLPIIYYAIEQSGAAISSYRIEAPKVFTYTATKGWWYCYFKPDGTHTCTQATPSAYQVLLCQFYHDGVNVVSRSIRTYPSTVPTVVLERFRRDGAMVYSGLNTVANPLTTGSPNADGRNTVVSIVNGTILEGNLYYSIYNSQLPGLYGPPPIGSFWTQDLGEPTLPLATSSAMLRVVYIDATNTMVKLPATRFPFPTLGGVIAYYQTNGTLTALTNTQFAVMFIYAVQDWVNGEAVRVITAPKAFASLALADAYAWENLAAETNFKIEPHVRQLSKLIYESRNTYSPATYYAALRKVVDLRTQPYSLISVSSGSVVDTNVVISALPVGYVSTNQAEMNMELASKISGGGGGSYLPLTGGTLTGALQFYSSAEDATVQLNIGAEPGFGRSAFYMVGPVKLRQSFTEILLKAETVKLGIPGAELGSLLTIAGFDGEGHAQIGYRAPIPPNYEVTDTHNADVIIKAPAGPLNSIVPVGLVITSLEAVTTGRGTISFSMTIENPSAYTGTLGFSLKQNSSIRPLVVTRELEPGFNDIVIASISWDYPIAANDVFTLYALATAEENPGFQIIMRASDANKAQMTLTGEATGVETDPVFTQWLNNGNASWLLQAEEASNAILIGGQSVYKGLSIIPGSGIEFEVSSHVDPGGTLARIRINSAAMFWSRDISGYVYPAQAYDRLLVETNIGGESAITGNNYGSPMGIGVEGNGLAPAGVGVKGYGINVGIHGSSDDNLAGYFTSNGQAIIHFENTTHPTAFFKFTGNAGSGSLGNINNTTGDGAPTGPKLAGTGAGWLFNGMLKIYVANGTGTPEERWIPYYQLQTIPT